MTNYGKILVAIKDILIARENIPALAIEEIMHVFGYDNSLWEEDLDKLIDEIESDVLKQYKYKQRVDYVWL